MQMDTRLEKIIDKQKHKDFDEMLKIFRGLDDCEYELSPRFAVLKSVAIQLSDNSYGYSLQDAEHSLLDALKSDENYINAYIELAYYYYAVDDDAQKALIFFDQAISKSKGYLREAIIGKAKSLVDLDREKEALLCLNERFVNESDFELIRKEILE
jgi:hypothetical protein